MNFTSLHLGIYNRKKRREYLALIFFSLIYVHWEKKKLSILDNVSFENFLIRRLYVKGPYNPFVSALMRNKITPEPKKKKYIVYIAFLSPQKKRTHSQQASLPSSGTVKLLRNLVSTKGVPSPCQPPWWSAGKVFS